MPANRPTGTSRFDCAGQAFLSVVNNDPDRPALVMGALRWTYGQLCSASTRGAARLRSVGFRNGDVVAVTGPRSPELIAAMLAVLLARGILLTLDPKLPLQRRRAMLEESGARFMFSVGGPAEEFQQFLPVIAAPSLDAGTALCLPDFRPADPADPAYIFFTSGTTGKPQGVLGRSSGLAHFLYWQRTRFAVGVGDRCSQLVNLSFDPVLRDVFLPLTCGAALYLPDATQSSPDRVLDWIVETRITLVHAVPTLARAWLDLAPTRPPSNDLRLVFFAGEFLSSRLAQEFQNAFPSAQLVNLYGPTETTLAKTFYLIPEPPDPGIQPVGQAMPDTQILLCKPTGELCAPGEAGEVAIRTPFASLGYINEPEKARRRFRPNPATHDPADPVYFTGDLGVFRQDGMLELLGRVDDQVKIRGVRVEPKEIKVVIESLPGVRQCEVLVHRTDSRVDLAAYIAGDASLNQTSVRKHLQNSLPAAAIPSRFIFLPQLPSGPNGKVDRGRLRELGRTPRRILADEDAPRTPVESRLIGLWKEILAVPDVRRNDDFFELGGDSLAAVELVVAAHAFGLHIDAAALEQHPKLADLAETCIPCELGPALVATSEESKEFPLLPTQADILSLARPETFTLEPWLSEIKSSVYLTRVRDAVRQLLDRHEALRASFIRTDSGWRQIIEPPGSLDVDVPVFHTVNDIESLLTMDLGKAPLVRAAVLRTGSTPDLVVLVVHHLIADGYSQRIIQKELLAFLNGGLPDTQQPSPARWARELHRMAGRQLIANCQYWLEQRSTGVPPPPAAGLMHRFEFTVETKRDRSLRDACLAAAIRTIAQWSGASRFWMEIAHHGRTEAPAGINLTHTVGCLYWVYPAWFDAAVDAAPQLAAVPRNGLAFSVARWLATDSTIRDTLERIRSSFYFNYLGDTETPAHRYSTRLEDLSSNLDTPVRLFFAHTGSAIRTHGYLRGTGLEPILQAELGRQLSS
jgi:amino acid adenylation domain-containing protein